MSTNTDFTFNKQKIATHFISYVQGQGIELDQQHWQWGSNKAHLVNIHNTNKSELYGALERSFSCHRVLHRIPFTVNKALSKTLLTQVLAEKHQQGDISVSAERFWQNPMLWLNPARITPYPQHYTTYRCRTSLR